MAVDAEAFRAALGRWSTGVSIVTARHGDTVHGMTVSAFSSVSLDPPLVLVCADRSSITQRVIEAGRVFAVNVLCREQEGLSNRFASREDEMRRFEGVEWKAGVTGAPLLPGSLASLDCRVVAAHEAGDHVIYVGSVEAIERDETAQPLLYYAGAYRALADAE